MLSGMATLHHPVRVTVDDGIGTVGFAFAGDPGNRLGLPESAAVVAACAELAARPDVEIVVVTGDSPAGFCPGAGDGPTDRAGYSAAGQRLTAALAALPVVTVANVAGPCRGPGFELALACDYRFAVARADSWVGFDGPPAWGGSARVRRPVPDLMTAREAVRRGVFTDAVCARLGRIELRQLLDRLQRRPHKPWRRPDWVGAPPAARLAAERRAFAAAGAGHRPVARAGPFAAVVDDPSPDAAAVAVEVLMRGGRVRVGPAAPAGWADAALAAGAARGRWTPLEIEQALRRLTGGGPDLVGAAGPDADTISAWRRDLGLPPPVRPPRVSLAPHAERRQAAAA